MLTARNNSIMLTAMPTLVEVVQRLVQILFVLMRNNTRLVSKIPYCFRVRVTRGTRRAPDLSHVSLNTLVWYDFLFRTFAKRFHISARILTNLRDNFTNLSAL